MIVDKLGQEITPGAFIAYGHSLGRCGGLRVGKVLAIEGIEKSERFKGGWETVTRPRFRVRGIDDDYGNARAAKSDGFLSYPNRIIRLEEAQVPEKYREILAEFPVIAEA
jgi:hypothetical protein